MSAKTGVLMTSLRRNGQPFDFGTIERHFVLTVSDTPSDFETNSGVIPGMRAACIVAFLSPSERQIRGITRALPYHTFSVGET